MAKTGSKTSRKREKCLKNQTLPRSNTIRQMYSWDGWRNMPYNRPHSMRFKRTTSFEDTPSLGTVTWLVEFTGTNKKHPFLQSHLLPKLMKLDLNHFLHKNDVY